MDMRSPPLKLRSCLSQTLRIQNLSTQIGRISCVGRTTSGCLGRRAPRLRAIFVISVDLCICTVIPHIYIYMYTSLSLSIYIYIYPYLYLYIYIYIYIYISIYLSLSLSLYIYIYICICFVCLFGIDWPYCRRVRSSGGARPAAGLGCHPQALRAPISESYIYIYIHIYISLFLSLSLYIYKHIIYIYIYINILYIYIYIHIYIRIKGHPQALRAPSQKVSRTNTPNQINRNKLQ